MGISIGIDLGTSFTSIYYYNQISNSLESLTQDEFIPSVVAIDKEDHSVEVGTAAESCRNDDEYQIYDGFKMMIGVTDEAALKQKNFNKEITPEYITSAFLQANIEDGLVYKGLCDPDTITADSEPLIDSLVICMPWTWYRYETGKLSSRSRLYEICKNLRIYGQSIETVKIVIEPQAATAFYAYQANKKDKLDPEYKSLIVDYGGGTLDLTMASIQKFEDGRVSIDVESNTGVGEVHEHKFGQAGVAFMERILELSCPDYVNLTASDKHQALKLLEKDVISCTNSNRNKDKFQKQFKYCDSYENYEGSTSFGPYNLDHTRIESIPFKTIYQAYDEIVKNTLDEQLTDLLDLFKFEHNIEINPTNKDEKIKINLVGGFSQFYLVEKQIQHFFNPEGSTVNDDRFLFTISMSDRRGAIAKGAALLANKMIEFVDRYSYSLGIELEVINDDGWNIPTREVKQFLLIDNGTERTNDIHYLKENNEIIVKEIYSITKFIYKEYKNEDWRPLWLGKNWVDKLNKELMKMTNPATKILYGRIGVNIDDLDNISVYIEKYNGKDFDEPREIKLTRLDELHK